MKLSSLLFVSFLDLADRISLAVSLVVIYEARTVAVLTVSSTSRLSPPEGREKAVRALRVDPKSQLLGFWETDWWLFAVTSSKFW
jgi:hypothetical protein